MDSESVRRRMNMIVAHFAPTIADDISSPARLLPLNCSGSLNSVIRRYDNRMCFARQGSASQACFMRQAQGSSEKGLRSSASSETEWSCNAELVRDETPLFSRPAKIKPNLPKVEPALTPAKYCKSTMSALPKFARPNRSIINSRKGQCQFEKTIYSPESNGIEWSPKMDVVESGVNYVLTIEIPGVNFNDIRVEIHGQNLKVTGPYEIVWRLPVDGNKDSVSAEFLDGFLQVTVPKM
ncbi:HEAT SHOCK PROTEIN 26 [Salix purpurea]|uniref:HEAT SHOCK PROTEIN 26 n=1 Tax=Salix purpurea TaxID=77065 RepID=A0A9Q0P2U3_SALPP|nr:HEAT SHOCK PROTEIN 26 [Salix purpurea]